MYALGAAGCKLLPIHRQGPLALAMENPWSGPRGGGYRGWSGMDKATAMTKAEVKAERKSTVRKFFGNMVPKRFRRDR